jgi:hypothetical protein
MMFIVPVHSIDYVSDDSLSYLTGYSLAADNEPSGLYLNKIRIILINETK